MAVFQISFVPSFNSICWPLCSSMALLEAGSLAVPADLPLTEKGSLAAKSLFLTGALSPTARRVAATLVNLGLGLDVSAGGYTFVSCIQLCLVVTCVSCGHLYIL